MPDTAHSMNEGATPSEQVSDEDQDLLGSQARKAHRLGFSLLSSFSGNCVVSPSSVGVHLAMLAQGASLDARDQISEVSSVDPKALALALRVPPLSQSTIVAEGGRRATFEAVNAAWFDQGLKLKSGFKSALQSQFGALVSSYDASQLHEASYAANQWVAELTGGTIEHVVSDKDFEPFSFILAGVAHFNGPWARQFDRCKTRHRPFRCANGSIVSVPMMAKDDAWLGYAETDDFQAVDLPYAGGQFGLIVILPKTTSSVDDVTRRLSQDSPHAMHRRFEAVCGDLRLPRFEIRWQGNVNRALKAAGLDAVLNDASRLPGVTDAPLMPLKLIHNAFIRMDETGSETAASTTAGRKEGTRRRRKKSRFRMVVERPFVFVLYHLDFPGPLIVGRVEVLEQQGCKWLQWRGSSMISRLIPFGWQ